MMYGIIQWFIISLILIILVHHLFSFFKDTLTVPKVKDLVNQPAESYREIEKTLNAATSKRQQTTAQREEKIDQTEMKNELKSFFDNLRDNKGGYPPLTPVADPEYNKGGYPPLTPVVDPEYRNALTSEYNRSALTSEYNRSALTSDYNGGALSHSFI